ncbi:hypothetical protein ACRAWD_15025 [Caulobacter segnis]
MSFWTRRKALDAIVAVEADRPAEAHPRPGRTCWPWGSGRSSARGSTPRPASAPSEPGRR